MKISPLFMLYLAGLSILGLMATDMYLPAFTIMQQQLNSSAGQISLSLSIFLAGYAVAQLFWGPISDKYGKKPVILVGLILFTLSCLAMLWVESVIWLWGLRFIQSIGVCASAVCWQAIVVDRYNVTTANRVFATIMPLVALSPALAPSIGAWILLYSGWRSIFILLSVIAVALILATFFLQENKKYPANINQPILPKRSGYLELLASKVFVGNVLIYTACSASFFAWLTGSPFILSQLGYSPTDIGLSYIPQTIAFLIGGYGYRLLINRLSAEKLLPWLLSIYVICMAAMFIIAFMTTPTLLIIFIPFCTMAFVNGATYPIVVAAALMPFPQNSGKAAALQNTIQLSGCFIASSLVSLFLYSPLKTTVTIMFSTIVIVIAGYYWRTTQTKK